MSDTAKILDTWQEQAPQMGSEVISHWEMIEQSRLINPWRSWLRFTGGRSTDMLEAEPISKAFISVPGESLARDEEFEAYRQKFGWTDERNLTVRGRVSIPDLTLDDLTEDEKSLVEDIVDQAIDPSMVQGVVDAAMRFFLHKRVDDGRIIIPEDPNPVIDDRPLLDTAESVIEYCRLKTFRSFKEAVLGITLEFSNTLWLPEEHQDLNDYDVVPHQDWVRQDVPVAMVLGSQCYDPDDCDAEPRRQLNTNLWNGKYIYTGDLVDHNGYTMDYLHAVDSMLKVADSASGSRRLWIADARRGLHGRPTMQPNDEDVVRLFMRGFVAPVG